MAEFVPLAVLPLGPQWALSPILPAEARFLRLTGQGTGDSYALAFFSGEVSGILAPRRGLDLPDPLILPVPEIPVSLRIAVRQRRRYKRVVIRTKSVSIGVEVLIEDQPA